MLHAQWVFDSDAPLDEFQRRMQAALERRGWSLGPAQVYDFAASRPGVRALVKLAHHDWGVLVVAKVKHGWLSNGQRAQRAIWEAAREAQVQALGPRRAA